jgi:hypothetical protein
MPHQHFVKKSLIEKTQSIYYQRVRVNAFCFVTNSLPGIYKGLTDYCLIWFNINIRK